MQNCIENANGRLLREHKIFKQDAGLLRPIGRRDLQVIPGPFREYSERFILKVLEFLVSDSFKGPNAVGRIEITLSEYPDLQSDPVIQQVVEKLRDLSKIQKIDSIKINVYREEEQCEIHRDGEDEGDSAITAVASFGSERMLVFEHSPLAKLPQQWYIKPSDDLKIFIFGGYYYAFARGIYKKIDGEIIPSINRTHKHRVSRIGPGVQMSIVMWGTS